MVHLPAMSTSSRAWLASINQHQIKVQRYAGTLHWLH